MKKITLFLLTVIIGIAIKVNAQEEKKVCGNEAAVQQAIMQDPSLIQKQQAMEAQINQYLKDVAASRTTDNDSVLIIPTVFHVLTDASAAGGVDDIPDANIQSCINITNADYRRQNKDTVNTFEAFRPVAADTKIEFRLATIDPNGNCTNGIDRFYTHRTLNADDYIKSIVDWPANKYLNIWVVGSIGGAGFAVGGEIIGYVDGPPLPIPSSVDGVVLRYDYVGGIGVAKNNYAGRDADHEIGHYLDLQHIWGANGTPPTGQCACGDDGCADTPPQCTADYGCPVYPNITCGNNGDMSDNYMDYSDGGCKDIFTRDQKARMRAALYVDRFSLWQPSNLAATGTADPYTWPVTVCAPQADFLPVHKDICAGSSISFGDNGSFSTTATKGTATSWNWSFPGGTPPTSTSPNPMITYSNPGLYSVTLTSSNAAGSSTITRDQVAVVDQLTAQRTIPFTEDFENSLDSSWIFFNDDGGPGWERTSRAAYSGNYSLSIQNYHYEAQNGTAPNSVKEFYTPSFDFTGMPTPVLSFRLSYGQQTASNTDSLSIAASINCGVLWSELEHLASAPPNVLAAGSGGFQPNDFVPSHNQWSLVQIQLKPATYGNKSKVRFRFQFTTGILANNIYIDDINIANGTVGINEEENTAFSFNVFPNPSNESFTVNYTLRKAEDLTISLYDLQGRLIRQIENKHATPGSYQTGVDAKSFHLASGVYMLRMITTDGVESEKIIYSNY